jgi:GNAT superfamily N-acetyltransferase
VIEIRAVPPESARDASFVSAIVQLVNHAYSTAENGLWRYDVDRITIDTMVEAISNDEILIALHDGALVGSVQTHSLDPTTGWFGALATDPAQAQRGIGRALVEAAERRAIDQGCERMQLERLAPSTPHPHMERLAVWYCSMGYTDTERRHLSSLDPQAVDYVRDTCEVVVCHKNL